MITTAMAAFAFGYCMVDFTLAVYSKFKK